jgi:FtsH-binding integral membrane protein
MIAFYRTGRRQGQSVAISLAHWDQQRLLLGSGFMRRTYALVDLVTVLVFVGIGRSVHDHGVNPSGVVSTAWPFVVGLAAGWILTMVRRQSGSTPVAGLTICVVTVFVGMVLRVVAGQGTAFAFVLVALGFLGLFMIGSRLLAAQVRRLRRTNGSA